MHFDVRIDRRALGRITMIDVNLRVHAFEEAWQDQSVE